MQETILILDFGSQYTQLIARRVRELNVFCEIFPYNKIPVIDDQIKGVILSGSPYSIRDPKPLIPDLSAIRGKVPVLAVCYGAQYLAQFNGGEVMPSKIREYGRANLSLIDHDCDLLKGMNDGSQVWMSHGDTILHPPKDLSLIASTPTVKVAGFSMDNEQTYGIQFHPEVYHTLEGKTLLKNFVVDICGCHQHRGPRNPLSDPPLAGLRETLGDDNVVLGFSGGVDSSVAGMLAPQCHREQPALHLRR